MSKKYRVHASLSEENSEFFEAEMKRNGVDQPSPVLNFLLAELRELRVTLRRTPHFSTHPSHAKQ